ncbi:MAG: hypothetical protein AB7P03_01465 [Kofleriaceae bacterium]
MKHQLESIDSRDLACVVGGKSTNKKLTSPPKKDGSVVEKVLETAHRAAGADGSVASGAINGAGPGVMTAPGALPLAIHEGSKSLGDRRVVKA